MFSLIPYLTSIVELPLAAILKDLVVDAPGKAFSSLISSPSVKVTVPIWAVFTITELAPSIPVTVAVK